MRRNPNIDAYDGEAQVLERLDSLCRPSDVGETCAFLARLQLPENESGVIIELGCGLGRLTEALLATFPKARVVGVDGAPRLVAIARRRIADQPRVAFVVSAFETLDWKALPQQCAGVVAVHALEHVALADRREMFASIHALLRPGGVFLDKEWARDTTAPGVDPRDRSRPEHKPDFIRQAIAEGRITEEEHWRLWDKLAQPVTHHFMGLDEQLDALRQAGFREVAGEWLNDAITVVAGRR